MASLGDQAPDAIEVWNEQNIDFEWPAGQISPSSYVNNILAPAYRAIKAANGNILVISGALAPTGFDNGHYSWYYRPTVDLYYGAFGGSRKVCLTEIGYLTSEGFPGLPQNFAWASGTSLAEHAQWLAEADDIANREGKVRLFIVFNVDFTYYDQSGDPQAGYAIVRPDGSCPACSKLSAVIPR